MVVCFLIFGCLLCSHLLRHASQLPDNIAEHLFIYSIIFYLGKLSPMFIREVNNADVQQHLRQAQSMRAEAFVGIFSAIADAIKSLGKLPVVTLGPKVAS